jgi:hypothetical protein
MTQTGIIQIDNYTFRRKMLDNQPIVCRCLNIRIL